MFIDSHCHLDRVSLAPYDGSLEALLNATQKEKISRLLTVATDWESTEKAVDIAQKFPYVLASAGIHPSDSLSLPVIDLEKLTYFGNKKVVIAIGETGLDYHYHKENLEKMRESFRVHIECAKKVQKPLIIHSRSAPKDTIAIMQSENAESISGVMHCFTESWDMAKQALDLGFYISISGIITFKNANDLREVAKKIPEDRLLIETDSPFLAPVPYRGKSNEPRYVGYVAEALADIRHTTLEKIAEQTTENFYTLFPDSIL